MNKLEKDVLKFVVKSRINQETKKYFLSLFVKKELINQVEKYVGKISRYEKTFYDYLNPFRH